MARIRDLETKIKEKMLISDEQIVGKTISFYEHVYSILFGFDDGTFLILEKRYGYDDDVDFVEVTDVKKVSTYELRKLNVLTEEEIATLEKLRNKSSRDSARAWRKRQYEQLKEEFGE